MNFKEACRKFIACDSSQATGTEFIAKLSQELCVAANLHTEIQTDTWLGVPQANVVACSSSGEARDGILLITHLDTADPGIYASWNKTAENPFNASIYQDLMYGLGTASKLDFLCKLEAIKRMDRTRLKKPITLAGTYGEESGMMGTIKLVRTKKALARYALIGEPTGFRLASASLGLASVEVAIPFSRSEMEYRAQHDLAELTSSQSRLFYGRSGLSSHPKLGENAIVGMLKYLSQLPDSVAVLAMDGGVSFNTVPDSAMLELDIVGDLQECITTKIRAVMKALQVVEEDFYNYPAVGFDPEVPTMNIGTIRTLADHVLMKGTCRLPPTVGEEVYEKWIQFLTNECQKVSATFRVTEYKRPFSTQEDTDYVKFCQSEIEALGKDSRIGRISSCTEASVLGRVGIECLVFGPGVGVGNTHTPQESVSISDLEKAIEFYKSVMERVCC